MSHNDQPVAAIEKLAEERANVAECLARCGFQTINEALEFGYNAKIDRDKALADLVAVRAERDRLSAQVESAVRVSRESQSRAAASESELRRAHGWLDSAGVHSWDGQSTMTVPERIEILVEREKDHKEELEKCSQEIDGWNRDHAEAIADRDAARAELARLRMEQDGMCSAEELRQVRAERDQMAHSLRDLVDASDIRFVREGHVCDYRSMLQRVRDKARYALDITTPPTRSAPC